MPFTNFASHCPQHSYDFQKAKQPSRPMLLPRLNRTSPVSQICAFTVLPSTLIDLVANSTPIVDFDSRLNSLRVNLESTARWKEWALGFLPWYLAKRTIAVGFKSPQYIINNARGEKRTICRHLSHRWVRPIQRWVILASRWVGRRRYFEKVIVVASFGHCGCCCVVVGFVVGKCNM